MLADEEFLREAIALSEHDLDSPHGMPFGAVVVKEGRIIGRGFNRCLLDADPIAHAEIVAIRNACAGMGSYRIGGAVLYASSEPCPMCFAACLWAGVVRIVFGCSVADTAKLGFDDERFYRELSLPAGERNVPSSQLLRNEAWAVVKAFMDGGGSNR